VATDTIFAVATGPGRAGVAIVRVSGVGAGRALEELTDRPRPSARIASRRTIVSAEGESIDDGLVLWFPSPASYTGEDVAELHIHGGPAVVAAVLETLSAREGLRPAEAGEFTRRAFQSGKLDLTAAEGLADLVDAETEAQRRQALRQVHGELGAIYDCWRGRLLGAIGHLEATIDFADEDLPEGVDRDVFREITALKGAIGKHLADGRRGERIRAGIRIAIIGPPNAGKSSLLNVLAKREAAIVSHHPGTTRDVIEVALDLGGFPVIVADTAGMREAAGELEQEGVRRARSQARIADLKVAVFDGATWPSIDAETRNLMDGDTVAVINKSDLAAGFGDTAIDGIMAMPVSARTGNGIERLTEAIKSAVRERFSQAASPALTRVRHRRSLEECHAALSRCCPELDAELVAEDLRLAARALGRVTGRVDVEEVLDVIFRDFCVGK
jgi:tRNA modification GTPase